RRIPHCSTPQRGIIKGDTLSASIAAASIIAKTTRDAIMTELDSILPGYNFATHKGYPTPEHCRCLKELGATPIHRRSFARVREALGLDPIQDNYFLFGLIFFRRRKPRNRMRMRMQTFSRLRHLQLPQPHRP